TTRLKSSADSNRSKNASMRGGHMSGSLVTRMYAAAACTTDLLGLQYLEVNVFSLSSAHPILFISSSLRCFSFFRPNGPKLRPSLAVKCFMIIGSTMKAAVKTCSSIVSARLMIFLSTPEFIKYVVLIGRGVL